MLNVYIIISLFYLDIQKDVRKRALRKREREAAAAAAEKSKSN